MLRNRNIISFPIFFFNVTCVSFCDLRLLESMNGIILIWIFYSSRYSSKYYRVARNIFFYVITFFYCPFIDTLDRRTMKQLGLSLSFYSHGFI